VLKVFFDILLAPDSGDSCTNDNHACLVGRFWQCRSRHTAAASA